jgi:hypothetical protein
VHSTRRLEEVRRKLTWELGRENLELLPEYGIKLTILKGLDFVSDSEVWHACCAARWHAHRMHDCCCSGRALGHA